VLDGRAESSMASGVDLGAATTISEPALETAEGA
jgi:hypothetical protein